MLEQLITVVKSVARQEVMPRYLKVAHDRKNDGSLFTQADLAAQEALVGALSSLQDCPILGEEMSETLQRRLWQESPEGVWCVDPIDGTSNFVHGIPYFAISVALMRQGRPVLGVVYDPVADEAFAAEKGSGAWLNGVQLPIRASSSPLFREAIATVDLKRLPEKLARALSIHPPYASQRNFGASTLEWCYVAAGRFDLALHGGQKLWDYAAGSLILQETGGRYCTLEHDQFWEASPWNRSVIAALNPPLFNEWREWLRDRT
ncbi:MAG: inositol monophosphatase family protein [Burkholderiales bacterium]|nr:inositol monophosphatase family protein [Ferrovum sp.]